MRSRAKRRSPDAPATYSDAAAIKAADAPTITQQPSYVTCQVGDVAKFTVAATGGKTPYTYQWQWKVEKGANWSNLTDDSSITGAKKSTLSVKVTDQDLSLGSQYRCVITDANGSAVYSDAGKVQLPRPTVSKALTITQQPQNISVGTRGIGFTASISVAVTGGKAPYTYEWQEQHRTDPNDPNSVTAWRAVKDLKLNSWQTLLTYKNSAGKALIITEETKETVLPYCYMYRCKITDAAGTTIYSDPMRFIEFNCDISYVIVTSLDGTTATYLPPIKNIPVKGGDKVTIKANVTNAAGPFAYEWRGYVCGNRLASGSVTGISDTFKAMCGGNNTSDTLTLTIPNRKEDFGDFGDEIVLNMTLRVKGADGVDGVSMVQLAESDYFYLVPNF